MSSRYATIIIDDDGREVVSAISLFESVPQLQARRIEAVPPGVRIGMVRGGAVDAAGGFGFPLAGAGADGVRIVRAALKALPDAGPAKCGTTAEAKTASRPRKPKPARAKPGKRAKPRKRPTRAVKKTAKPEIAALAGTAG
ncbi:hypothetical protein EJ066_27665 [Mesorhizobium sp. M9A.F.Ca.ET.002.03.1.2]|uniref:hypothetical protein n=1 Tax=Mesorhizobium sp. M9A.F.Ca.ET.002.03.1.2 TaxID=2493668 RepID=UPI000F74F241|nr:hypothetical protein [Mesorhizobium sp. M9A.F.Ca.ET.002.03.1.2]AZO00592.1 hypothetical protein EJ066_27665 [Mesorhizobium sp. M9A.F.Ca.ET.002.03.1.2]